MIEALKEAKCRTVGTKQTRKAIKQGMLQKVFIAQDADNYVVNPVIVECEENNIEIVYVATMVELGKKCGIEVATATVGLIKK